MYNSRLVRQIKELSSKDRERFQQFVASPYFNQHESTLQLLDWIIEYLDADAKYLEKEHLYNKLFPGAKFDEQQMYNLMSNLKKLFHKFLAYQYVEKSPFMEPIGALEMAFEKSQFDVLTNRGKQLHKKLEATPIHDANFYYANYRMSFLLGYYGAQYIDRTATDTFQRMLDSLDKYYILEKLKNCCHLTANILMMNTSYEFSMFEELLSYVERNWHQFESEKSIVLYYKSLKSHTDENNPEHFQVMKQLLEKEAEKFSSAELRDLYGFSNNYCIRMINLGKSEYHRELLQLYRQGLRRGLLLNNDMISEWDYKNIATLGGNLKEFDWTERFLNDYKDKLSPAKRENAYNYNLGNFYYNKKEYNEALSYLLLVQFTDVRYHLGTTFLLINTYFALKDTEALLSLIETFRIYIIRNRKMSGEQKRGYTNFLRFTKKLVSLKHHASTFSRQALADKLNDLAAQIRKTDNVINKFWLLEECKP
ncbi:MAG TPA: hypothetical protein PKA00_19570 [Saprospiraceae bacterium]|nr:hypothetical protein [Saprospiraceae bacterium]HMQ85119.1 hypothetical protein [Saprospiraceae bacterium]